MNYELEEYKNDLFFLSDRLKNLSSEITEKDIATLDYLLPPINYLVSKMVSQIRMNHQIDRIKNKNS